MSKGVQGVERAEEAAAPVLASGIQKLEREAEREFDAAKAAATRAAERTLGRTREGVRQAREMDLQEKGAEIREHAKGVASGLKITEESIVDKAAGVIDSAVESGIALGKRAAGKAGEAVQDLRSGAGAMGGETDVQRALRQRYQKNLDAGKSVKELLAERYRPITGVPKDLRGL